MMDIELDAKAVIEGLGHLEPIEEPFVNCWRDWIVMAMATLQDEGVSDDNAQAVMAAFLTEQLAQMFAVLNIKGIKAESSEAFIARFNDSVKDCRENIQSVKAVH